MDFADLAVHVLEPHPTRSELRLFVADVYRLAAACLIARGLINPEETAYGRIVGRSSSKVRGRITYTTASDDPVLDIIAPLFARDENGTFYRLQGLLFDCHPDSVHPAEPRQRIRRWIETHIDRPFRQTAAIQRNRNQSAGLHAPPDELAHPS